MDLHVPPGLRKREAHEPVLPSATAPSPKPAETGRGPSTPFYEPKLGVPAGAETSLELRGIGPDYIRLRYERLPNGNFGADAAITRLITCLSSIYEERPELREELRRVGFVYHGEESLAEQHQQEDREEDPDEQEVRQEGGDAQGAAHAR